jgi:hypothetical protein
VAARTPLEHIDATEQATAVHDVRVAAKQSQVGQRMGFAIRFGLLSRPARV